jgi:hypothetical protein
VSAIAALLGQIKERNPTMRNDHLIVGYCDRFLSNWEGAIALEFYARRITLPKGGKVSSPVDSFQRIAGSVAIAG